MKKSLTLILLTILTVYPAPLISAQNSDTKIMSLTVTIEPALALKILGGGVAEKITFSQEDLRRGEISKAIQVKVTSNKDTPYKVFMIPIGSFVSEKGLDLPAEYMTFNILDVKKGKNEIPEPVSLPGSETLIYTSNPEGDGETFTIVFNLHTFGQTVPAGKYNLNFKFRLANE